LAAGCDLALHCNGDPGEMEKIAAAAGPISDATAERLRRGEAMRSHSVANGFDRSEAEAQLDALLTGARNMELSQS
jgi:beta-N-acetylhexosaminidase